ncbi:MAG: hypothetical protein ACRDPM_27250 [Solirubrobacteraceae bacterium]
MCTIDEFKVETGVEATAVLVSEWNTVRGGQIASSLMIVDSGAFRGAATATATVADPVCGMTVDPATAASRRALGPWCE